MSSADRDDLVFKALADSRRRQILDLLKEAPRTTGELCDRFEGSLDRCTVMQHIGVLERAGLIIARREGRQSLELPERRPLQGDLRPLDLSLRQRGGGAARAAEAGPGDDVTPGAKLGARRSVSASRALPDRPQTRAGRRQSIPGRGSRRTDHAHGPPNRGMGLAPVLRRSCLWSLGISDRPDGRS